MTAKCEERGGGLFLARETDRRVSRFVRVSSFSLCIFPSWGVECTTDAHHHHQSLSLPLESMSVIARCATFVATKTSLKQQFAVNNHRSSATKIVRYAIKERKRWEECLHLIILRFCDWFFFVFWEFELHRKWRENDVLLLLSFFSRKTTFDDDDVFHRHHRYADTTNTNETLSSSVRTRESWINKK